MKQFIILCSMVVLGVFLFHLIADGDGSLYGAVQSVWEGEIAARSVFP